MKTRLQEQNLSISFRKSEMLKKEIRNKNETQSENFINLGASLQKHHALVTLKDKGRGNGVTYLVDIVDIPITKKDV